MRKKTNFNIVNYVHLSYAGALADGALKGGGKDNTLKNTMNRNYKKMESDFKANVGVSSKEFMQASQKFGDAINAIAQMFRCQTIEEMKEMISPEKVAQLNLGQSASEALLAAARTTGYAEILGQLYSTKGSLNIDKKIEEIANSFSGINLYEENLKYLNSKGGGSNNKKKQAMMMALLQKAMENANTVRASGKGDTLFSSTFNWQDSSFDIVNKNLEDFQERMSKGISPKIGELEDIIKKSRNILNTSIKGASVGEYSSGIIASKIITPVIQGVTDAINVEIQHTGTKSSVKNIIEIPIAQIARKKTTIDIKEPIGAVAKGIHTFTAKDKKADITISYNDRNGKNKNVKISTKRYSTSANKVNISERMTIGQALAFSMNGTASVKNFTGRGKAGAQFYNALNFYLLGSSFNVKKEGPVATVYKEGSTPGITQIDAAFGGVLSKFLLDILAGVLEPETTTFMDINGMIIPTPMYYKYMMDRFFAQDIKNHISSYIGFNAQAFRNNTEDAILNPKNTGAYKTYAIRKTAKWKMGYAYDIAAFKRNLIVKQNILNHTISVRGNFLSLGDYRGAFLGI